MAESEKKKSKLVPILIIILIVVIAAATFVIVKLLDKQNGGESGLNYTSENGIGYEINAQVLTSDVEFATSQGDGIAVKYKPSAISSDGYEFDCSIGNSNGNKLDMYLAIYESDQDLNEQEPVYLSGLLRPGEGITHFKTNRKMPSGSYDVVLAFTLVEDDHKTLHGQSLVYLTFRVD